MNITPAMWNAETGGPVPGWELSPVGVWHWQRRPDLYVLVYRHSFGMWQWEVADKASIEYKSGISKTAYQAMNAAKRAARTMEE